MVNILIFFTITAIVDYCVGYAGDYMQVHAKGGSTKVLNDLVKYDYHDVIIFGSSRAHHHYDTPYISDALGVDVYNAGYDGNGVILAYGLLDMILERYTPKLVVFDIEPCFDINEYMADSNNKRYISSLKPYYASAGVSDVIRDVSQEEWYKVHSGMIRYNTCVVSLLADQVHSATTLNNGFEPLTGNYQGDPVLIADNNEKIDTLKLSYVKKLITRIKSLNIPVVVVASPKYYVGSDYLLQPVKEICREESVPFWDYYSNSEFLDHKEWFKEPMHLNEIGARNFSKKIAERLSLLLN